MEGKEIQKAPALHQSGLLARHRFKNTGSSQSNGLCRTNSKSEKSISQSENDAQAVEENSNRKSREAEEVIAEKVFSLVKRGKALGLSDREIRSFLDPGLRSTILDRTISLPIYRSLNVLWRRRLYYSVYSALLIILGLMIYLSCVYTFKDSCLIEDNTFTEEIMRRNVFPCDFCENLTSVAEVVNISQEEFVRLYGYSAVPVLVKGGASHWKAVKTFSFEYFRDFYRSFPEALEDIDIDCNFFPYNTEFELLSEALNMSSDRASFAKGEKPWYIGWSHCVKEGSSELRDQYERPYFLPHDVSTHYEDWIFMGGPGAGAGLHNDHILVPSWQAQISGSKTWTLKPSPECTNVCHKLEITLQKGDIVVVDTHFWYHSTYVHPGETSITIGSEYD